MKTNMVHGVKNVVTPQIRKCLIPLLRLEAGAESYADLLDVFTVEASEAWEPLRLELSGKPDNEVEDILTEGVRLAVEDIFETYRHKIPSETLADAVSSFLDTFPIRTFFPPRSAA